MKIVLGSSRIALIFGNFVLKFPRINPLLEIVKSTLKLIFEGKKWSIIHSHNRYRWHWFCKGIRQNITEYQCWKFCHATFLAPTYLTLGFVNIQGRMSGEEPSEKEMNTLLRQMCGATKSQLLTIDPHCFSTKNFIRSNSGYKKGDYGDGD